ncbi:MAG TPA: DUF6390 family protein [Thermoplasmata archaeon]|nr:DUF6390 family protein [Thermoplasmata archaeon]
MDGVSLGARFSLATSRLQYCGPDGADRLLYRAATTPDGHAEARNALAQFEALYPYLELIGAKHGLDPFDARVVGAYWLGNDLLDPFERADFVRLLDRLVQRGLPRALARRLADHLPARPLPHHAFHVSFVGVGNVTGHVPTTLANMQSCRPAWGPVVARDARSITLDLAPLEWDGRRLSLGAPQPASFERDPGLLPELAVGDEVAVHWRTAGLRLTGEQVDALRRYTALSLDAASEALPRLGVLPRTGVPP